MNAIIFYINKPLIKYGIPILFIFLTSISNFYQKVNLPITQELDEAAWIFSSVYFHTYFEEHDIEHLNWSAIDAVDHPPLMKYLLGWVLSWEELHEKTLNKKNWWFYHADINTTEGYDNFKLLLNKMIPEKTLFIGRALTTFFMFLSAILLFYISCRHFNTITGILTTTLFLTSNTIQVTSCWIISDYLFILLMLLNIYITAILIHRLFRGIFDAKLYLIVLVAALFSALHFLTKISGILSFALVISVFCIGLGYYTVQQQRQHNKHLLTCILLYTIIFLTLLYYLNPSFQNDMISFIITMFKHRTQRISEQHAIFYPFALPTTLLSISHVFKSLFSDYSLHSSTFSISLLLSLILLLPLQFKSHFRYNRTALFIMALSAVWFAAIALSTKIAFTRYLLPLIPIVYLCSSYSFVNIMHSVMQFKFRKDKFTIYSALLLILCSICTLSAANYYTLEKYIAENPEWLYKQINDKDAYLKAHMKETPFNDKP